MQASLKAGEVVTLPNVDTIADGTAVKTQEVRYSTLQRKY